MPARPRSTSIGWTSRGTDVQAIHDLIRVLAPELNARIEYGMLAYGSYHYRSASGREGDWFVIGRPATSATSRST